MINLVDINLILFKMEEIVGEKIDNSDISFTETSRTISRHSQFSAHELSELKKFARSLMAEKMDREINREITDIFLASN